MKIYITTNEGELELLPLEPETVEAVSKAEVTETIGFEEQLEAARTHRDFVLARGVDIPEVKTEWEQQCVGGGWARICTDIPVIYRRTCAYNLIGRVSTGRITNDMVWDAVRGCLIEAAISAGVAALVAGSATAGAGAISAAQAALYSATIACLRAKGGEFAEIASDIRFSLRTEKTCGGWRRSS